MNIFHNFFFIKINIFLVSEDSACISKNDEKHLKFSSKFHTQKNSFCLSGLQLFYAFPMGLLCFLWLNKTGLTSYISCSITVFWWEHFFFFLCRLKINALQDEMIILDILFRTWVWVFIMNDFKLGVKITNMHTTWGWGGGGIF